MNPRVHVKMCGMTRAEDIAYASSLGVDAIGLIFYPKSPRAISLDKAVQLTENIPPFLSVVAVLVNPDPIFVHDLLAEVPIHVLQFHGDETPEFCEQFNRPYIKSLQTESTGQMQQAVQTYAKAAAILFDTPSASTRGGTGQSFDWQVIPKNLAKPYILAGGINEGNIDEALLSCSPYAIDMCSGIESAPGVKDHTKMSRFIKAIWGK